MPRVYVNENLPRVPPTNQSNETKLCKDNRTSSVTPLSCQPENNALPSTPRDPRLPQRTPKSPKRSGKMKQSFIPKKYSRRSLDDSLNLSYDSPLSYDSSLAMDSVYRFADSGFAGSSYSSSRQFSPISRNSSTPDLQRSSTRALPSQPRAIDTRRSIDDHQFMWSLDSGCQSDSPLASFADSRGFSTPVDGRNEIPRHLRVDGNASSSDLCAPTRSSCTVASFHFDEISHGVFTPPTENELRVNIDKQHIQVDASKSNGSDQLPSSRISSQPRSFSSQDSRSPSPVFNSRNIRKYSSRNEGESERFHDGLEAKQNHEINCGNYDSDHTKRISDLTSTSPSDIAGTSSISRQRSTSDNRRQHPMISTRKETSVRSKSETNQTQLQTASTLMSSIVQNHHLMHSTPFSSCVLPLPPFKPSAAFSGVHSASSSFRTFADTTIEGGFDPSGNRRKLFEETQAHSVGGDERLSLPTLHQPSTSDTLQTPEQLPTPTDPLPTTPDFFPTPPDSLPSKTIHLSTPSDPLPTPPDLFPTTPDCLPSPPLVLSSPHDLLPTPTDPLSTIPEPLTTFEHVPSSVPLTKSHDFCPPSELLPTNSRDLSIVSTDNVASLPTLRVLQKPKPVDPYHLEVKYLGQPKCSVCNELLPEDNNNENELCRCCLLVRPRLQPYLRDSTAPPGQVYSIGSKVGVKQVDFVQQLIQRRLHHVVYNVMDRLSQRDIYVFSNVSHAWKNFLMMDKSFNRKRLQQIALQRKVIINKENFRKAQPVCEINVKQIPNKPMLSPILNSRVNACRMTKCSKCGGRAEVIAHLFKAVCRSCAFSMCTKCHSTWHKELKCTTTTTGKVDVKDKTTIGSKKSKKNLKRM